MKQKNLLILVWCLLLSTVTWAQTRTITGRVSSVEGSGLPGVTILERGTTNGTSTNADGNYSLSVQPNAALVVSSIGFESQTVTVGSAPTLNVTLKTSATELSEAVVVGYGTQSKADLTGSVTQISGREVQNAPVPSFEQAIQGKAAGVFIETSSGKVGQGIKVRVRGTSSVSGGTQPLYVVDGIPIISDDQSGTSAPTNPIADLNPNDIESISVLKDASASAIYGSRASNGVVLITTRRGKAGATRFTLGFQTGTSRPTNKRDFLNAQQYVELFREAAAYTQAHAQTTAERSQIATTEARLQRYSAGNNDYQTGAINADWQDEAFQRAPFSQYDLNASGGNDKTKFYISGLYSKQSGILIGNKFEKIAARLNLDHKATDKLTLGVNLGLTRTVNNRISNDNAFSTPMQIVSLAPITPIIDPRTNRPSGALDTLTGLPNTNYPTYYNPYLNYIGSTYTTTSYRVLGNVYAQYDLFKGLSFRSELGMDLLNQDEYQYQGRVTARNSGFANNGTAFNRHVTNGRYTTNNFFTYRSTFAANHTLEAVLGMSYEERRINANSLSAQQFASDAYKQIVSAASITAGSSTSTGSSLLSYFGRVNYAFANRYLLSLSARVDGSSRFGTNERYGFFPAASVGWVVTEEEFLKNQNVLSFLKPRVSIGRTGNQDFSDFASLGLYAGDAGYVGTPGQRPIQLANPDLKWETTTQTDAGLEAGFLDNRISIEVDVYRKLTKDLALNVNVPGTSGFTTQFRNVGNLENEGVEFALNTRNLVGAFTWSTNFNVSANRNKITNLQGQVIEGGFLNRAVEGQPIGVFYGREYAGVNPENGDALYYLNRVDENGNTYIDHSAGTTNNYDAANRVVLGNPNPKWTGGITNTFTFKGLDLGFTFQGVSGNKIYDGGGKFFSASASNGYDNQTIDQLNRWRKPGDITDVPEARLNRANGTGESSRYLADGSYVRLKTLTFGYTLPTSLVKYAKMQSVRVFFNAVNLLTFTKYDGWDPEVNADYLSSTNNGTTTSSANISQGNSFYTAPQARTMTFGINVGF